MQCTNCNRDVAYPCLPDKQDACRHWERAQKVSDRTVVECVAAEALLNAVNPIGFDAQLFADRLVSFGHRTLQQGVMRIIVALLRRWASDYNRGTFDARNEATCRISAEIITKLHEDSLHLPFI